jgi:hypothetical protein
MSLLDKIDNILQLPRRLFHAVRFIRNHHLSPFYLFFHKRMLHYVSEEGKMNDGETSKALYHARLRALVASKEVRGRPLLPVSISGLIGVRPRLRTDYAR